MKSALGKKRIVLGVTGSIACYKSVELARYLMKRGCDVRVVMTESATKFVTPLTFESLTRNPVAVHFWSETHPGAIGHIELADWADLVLIAPATADCIAKMSYGFADSSLLAITLATKAPIVLAPAMNVNMYEHPKTQENLRALRERGVCVIEPESGDLACGWTGSGRLASIREIFLQTMRTLGPGDLAGQRVLISTGPTREPIDPVRFISNRSSGKMGIALVNEAYRRGATVELVHGPLSGTPSISCQVTRTPVLTAREMSEVMQRKAHREAFDIVIMAAAVADYRPAQAASEKIKKSTNPRAIELEMNEDILFEIGKKKGDSEKPFLVGFAVETGSPERAISEAHAKRERKNADMIVGNLAQDSFDRDTNQVWMALKDGETVHVETARKSAIAQRIYDTVVKELRS